MDPLNIRQAVSLTTVYEARAPERAPEAQRGLGDRRVEVAQDGVARAFREKGTWDRFKSRVAQGFKAFKDIFVSDDSAADRRAVRFNARHEKFSGKVENLVARLVRGEMSDVQSADVMATLRNDVKLLNQDAPWAGRREIFATRLDIELSKLSNEQLAALAGHLRGADQTNLTAKDKADLATIMRAVVRQQISRSEAMGNLIGAVNHGSPQNVDNRDTVVARLKTVTDAITASLGDFHLPDLDGGRNEDILSGAIRMRLRQGDQARLPGMNRNLMNLELGVRGDNPANRRRVEISERNPTFRVLSRAVREEFLHTRVGDFQDTRLRSRMKVLGAGAAHQVCKGTYQRANGDREARVHKYDDEQLGAPGERFSAPKRLGIDQTNPRLLERAVVTAEYDRRLGFNVSVGTTFARHNDQLGIVMTLAEGATAHSTWGARGSTATGQRELTKLQLLDSLTGQADRHQGNYMVQMNREGEITGIKAIDSDFSMGPEPDDPESIVGQSGVHLTHLPPVIDADMARAIRAMTREDIVAMCDNMFDDATVSAAIARLDRVKAHVDKLEREGNVIRVDQWGSERVTNLLKNTTVDGEHTSYWQRDHGTLYRPFPDGFD